MYSHHCKRHPVGMKRSSTSDIPLKVCVALQKPKLELILNQLDANDPIQHSSRVDFVVDQYGHYVPTQQDEVDSAPIKLLSPDETDEEMEAVNRSTDTVGGTGVVAHPRRYRDLLFRTSTPSPLLLPPPIATEAKRRRLVATEAV